MVRANKTPLWFAVALLFVWAHWSNVSPAFTPLRVELTDARGFSRGLLNFVVLGSSRPFEHVSAWSLLAVAAGFFLLGRVPPLRLRGWRQIAQGIIAGAAVTLIAAAAISSVVTTSRIVFAPRTFWLACLLLAFSRLAHVAVRVRANWPVSGTTSRRLGIAASGAIGAIFFASMMLQTLSSYQGNYSGFLHISRDTAATAPVLLERPVLIRSLVVYDAGYDGQFMYLMAFDPFLSRFKDEPAAYRRVVDNPPYRYGRIGLSLLTDWFSAGRAERYPATIMWLLVVAHFALAALLATWATRYGKSAFAGLLYLSIPSFAVSLLFALPEGLAAAGMVAGVVFWQARRLPVAAVCFGAALLVRETGIVLIIALILVTAVRDHRSGLILTSSILPVAVWRAFVATRLFADFGWHALFTDPGALTLPFRGIAQLWTAGLLRTQAPPERAAAVVLPLLLIAALILALCLLACRRGPLEFAAVGYGAIAVSLDYEKVWRHLPSGERGVFELFVCLVLLVLESGGQPLWIRRSLNGLVVILFFYTFAIAPEASASRAALLLIR
jgi:hypothetical protein